MCLRTQTTAGQAIRFPAAAAHSQRMTPTGDDSKRSGALAAHRHLTAIAARV